MARTRLACVFRDVFIVRGSLCVVEGRRQVVPGQLVGSQRLQMQDIPGEAVLTQVMHLQGQRAVHTMFGIVADVGGRSLESSTVVDGVLDKLDVEPSASERKPRMMCTRCIAPLHCRSQRSFSLRNLRDVFRNLPCRCTELAQRCTCGWFLVLKCTDRCTYRFTRSPTPFNLALLLRQFG